MKWFVYNLLFALTFPFLLPGFLLRMFRRGGYRARLLDRFGLYPKPVVEAFRAGGDFVWIHAVSVGEVQVAGQLMREWRKAEPSIRFCFSTTSSTGWKMAEREVKVKGEGEEGGDILIYNPLDFPSFVKSALKLVRPRAIILTESEIWPVFIRFAHKLGIPVFLINARVSDRSAPRYKLARSLFKDVFACFARIFAQSELDRERLLAAGAPRERTLVTGSFKFDVAHRNPAKEAELRAWLNLPEKSWVLLGGSTWPGEDEVLLRAYRALLSTHLSTLNLGSPNFNPRPILVLAPRHFEKADAVEANIRKAGFECVRRSRGELPRALSPESPAPVYLADTTGELMGLYGLADAVFVGKSLCAHGSQNMIEPCLCGKPTVVGPYTENFRPVMSDLLEGEGVVQVRDAEALVKTISEWYGNGDGGLGDRAREAVARRCGVVPKCVRAISSMIPKMAPARPRHGGGSAGKGLLVTLGFLAFVALVAGVIHAVWRPPLAVDRSEIPFTPLWTVSAHVALLEKPDARRVLLADAGAERYRAAFEHALIACPTNTSEGVFDIVLSTAHASADLAPLVSRLSESGILVWGLNVKDVSAADFRCDLETFPCPEAHLWMPSETEWLLVGRKTPRTLKLSAMLDLFTRSDAALSDLAEAECDALADLFASYVGTLPEVMGAFAHAEGAAKAVVRPEYFVPAEIPALDWVARDPEVDEEVFASLGRDFHRVQVARRFILEGAMQLRSAPGVPARATLDAIVEKWEAAMLHNAHDPMMLDRLHRLQINAAAMERVGNFKGAANCYEMLLLIRPKNAAALLRYADCMRLLGNTAYAAELRKKAEEVLK